MRPKFFGAIENRAINESYRGGRNKPPLLAWVDCIPRWKIIAHTLFNRDIRLFEMLIFIIRII